MPQQTMKIFFIDGPKAGEPFELKPPGISVGRETDNDLILDLEGCSRYHCKLEWTDDGWCIKDLGSTNGTKVNGTAISAPFFLKEGDTIKIGGQKLLFGTRLDSEVKQGMESDDPNRTMKSAPSNVKTITEITVDKNKIQDKKSSFLDFFSREKAPQPERSGKESAVNFFGGKKTEQPPPAAKQRTPYAFYVILALVAFLLVCIFVLAQKIFLESQQARTEKKPVETGGIPLTVFYVKQITSPDNIFRYELAIKGDSISVTRDDLKCQMRFKKEKQITPEQLQELESSIRQTDFMNLQEQQPGVPADGADENKTLKVAYGNCYNSVRIRNTFEPTSFKEIVTLLEDFSRNALNIPPFSLTVEEMKEESKTYFDKAEQLYANWQAKDDNLKGAIKRYQAVLDMLQFFEPKPELYERSMKQMQEAKKILDDEIRALAMNAEQQKRLRNFPDAKNYYRRIMDMLDPDDKRYQQSRDQILRIDQYINSTTKKKKGVL